MNPLLIATLINGLLDGPSNVVPQINTSQAATYAQQLINMFNPVYVAIVGVIVATTVIKGIKDIFGR